MRNALRAAMAAMLFAAPRAGAASAEPELSPLFPAKRSMAPLRVPSRALPPAPKPAPAPVQRDEVRDDIRRGPPRRAYVTVRSRLWAARSSVDTRYSIQIPREQISPPAEVFVGETEERVASGAMLVNSVEIAPLTWLSGELEYGLDRPRGRYTDRFWLHSPHSDTLTNTGNGAVWHKPDHEDDMIFEADHAARREWVAANVFFRIHEGRVTGSDELEVKHALDVALGVHRFRQDSRFTNLRRTLSNGKIFTPGPIGPISGFDSSYAAMWRGPHLGFREEMTVPLGFSFEALLMWSPMMEYRGDGFNNLDGTLRTTSPNYDDRARGSALHFRLGAAWAWSVARLEAGYMRLSFKSNRGKRRYYGADGGTEDQAVELTETEAAGLFVGASLRF